MMGGGLAILVPIVTVSGVVTSCWTTRTLRVASYASSVTNSSTRSLKVGDGVLASRKTVTL